MFGVLNGTSYSNQTWEWDGVNWTLRGTPQTIDDVPLQRGQSWVSVTSPTEGTTHVTVLAPDAANWDQRRQTATIYWVDVEWTLPGQTIVQAGQPQVLTTTLRRRSGKPP